jgi:hypothetical protein
MFRWVPGITASDEVVARMRSPKPHKPMGEAWFMSEKRVMYTELTSEPISKLSCKYFQYILFELCSGKTSFGEDADEGWRPWLRHLLPELTLRAHEQYVSYLLDDIVTAFTVYFGQAPDTEYPGFQRDAVNSIGIALMNPDLWQNHKNAPDEPAKRTPVFLVREHESLINKLVGFRDSEDTFSSAMFFCLKYLTPADMTSWVDSIFAIEHSLWRSNFLLWLIGAQRLLAEGSSPALEEATPKIDWSNSFLLRHIEGPLISTENAKAFSEQVKRKLTNDLIDQWEKQLKEEKLFMIEPRENLIESLDWLISQARTLAIAAPYPKNLG